MTHIFNGKEKSKELLDNIKDMVSSLKIKPSLTIIRTGNNPSQIKFTNIKKRVAHELEIKCNIVEYPRRSSTDEVIELIKLSASKSTGIMVQLPLPDNIDKERVLNSIPYDKDVEGLGKERSDKLIDEIPDVYSPVAKAIVETCKEAVKEKNIQFKNIQIDILGKSHLLGHPVYQVLSKLCPNIKVIDSKTQNIHEITVSSDIIISGIGKPNFITPDMFKKGVIAIDGGFEIDKDGKIQGDFNPKVANKSSFFTPVPGGIGPLTVAYIFDNLLNL
jgi:methylenetetrahydrofolate dehydrogenase (NADP+)/methenyltetrahydrofolate cyclohydrolase